MQVLVQSSVRDGLKNGRSKASSISKCLCAHVGNAGLHRQLPIVTAPLRIKALRKRKVYLPLSKVLAGAADCVGGWGGRLCGGRWGGRHLLGLGVGTVL